MVADVNWGLIFLKKKKKRMMGRVITGMRYEGGERRHFMLTLFCIVLVSELN